MQDMFSVSIEMIYSVMIGFALPQQLIFACMQNTD